MKIYKILTITLLSIIMAYFFTCDKVMQESPNSFEESPTIKSFAKLPPLSGAIFTTDENGTLVNGNLFDDKCDVYLDGGPGPNAPKTAAGLPDGDYYFQVTDPSGKKLLSTDPVENRQFEVTDGIISGLSGAGNHATGLDIDWDAVTIQLCPFDDTPNNGGVYKVWVTRVGDFDGDPALVDNGYSPGYFHGFIPAYCKTDNFKVGHKGRAFCLEVIKFYDICNFGVWDRNGRDREYQLIWPVTVFDPNGAQINGILYTPFKICNLTHGTYTVNEENTNSMYNYVVSANILDGESLTPPSQTVEVRIKNSNRTLIFGNACADYYWPYH